MLFRAPAHRLGQRDLADRAGDHLRQQLDARPAFDHFLAKRFFDVAIGLDDKIARLKTVLLGEALKRLGRFAIGIKGDVFRRPEQGHGAILLGHRDLEFHRQPARRHQLQAVVALDRAEFRQARFQCGVQVLPHLLLKARRQFF